MENLALLTDLYQLTMMGGTFFHQKLEQKACFELYFRRLPFKGTFCVAAGLDPALDYLESLRFGAEELDYLDSLDLFPPDFLKWLAGFSFTGDVWAMPEGQLVFPGQPLLRIEAPMPQAQLVESTLLNIINFQTLVATKAARVNLAAGDSSVFEFGLRRAQGINGALSASRAAFVGGCQATSNVLAGKTYGIAVRGTHSHSWVMSFPSELEAFRAYAAAYPTTCTLLVDTFCPIQSGIPNAIKVAQELARDGFQLQGIRLDSGDLAQLASRARQMLDAEGLTYVKIVASNDLDEYHITELRKAGAPIDMWGVGTNLVTCKDEPALGGVYKLVAAGDENGFLRPRLKLSSDPGKASLPGCKQVWRGLTLNKTMVADLVGLADETAPSPGFPNPSFCPKDRKVTKEIEADSFVPLLSLVMKSGQRLSNAETLKSMQQRCLSGLSSLPDSLKVLASANPYWSGISPQLMSLFQKLSAQVESEY